MTDDIRRWLRAYHVQKCRAKYRGIGWELTFHQWLTWWGDDIHRRGTGSDQLQMQRVADTGPYRLDNIRKGYPRDNSRTAARMFRKRQGEQAAADLQRRWDDMMDADSVDLGHRRGDLDDDERDLLDRMGYQSTSLYSMRGR